jgi:hypothetical protein
MAGESRLPSAGRRESGQVAPKRGGAEPHVRKACLEEGSKTANVGTGMGTNNGQVDRHPLRDKGDFQILWHCLDKNSHTLFKQDIRTSRRLLDRHGRGTGAASGRTRTVITSAVRFQVASLCSISSSHALGSSRPMPRRGKMAHQTSPPHLIVAV